VLLTHAHHFAQGTIEIVAWQIVQRVDRKNEVELAIHERQLGRFALHHPVFDLCFGMVNGVAADFQAGYLESGNRLGEVVEQEPVPDIDVAAAPEPVAEPAAEPAPPPPLFSDARWRETAKFTGADTSGRLADFTAYVLVGDETWTFARSDAIFAAGLSQPVETAFANLNLGAGICTMDRVIAVGAASVEGTSVQNTFLSHTRGHALKTAIAANLPCEANAVPATVLDLGYSRADVTCPAGQKVCADLSAPQRPIAMIFAEAREPATDIGEALRSGIAAHEASGASVLPGVLVSDYSAFDLR
jgi:hypothetical protein